MNHHRLYLALASLLVLVPLRATAEDVEGRLTRIENILEHQRDSDLLLQVQGLEHEIQRLRGLVEQQNHELQRLQGGTAPAPEPKVSGDTSGVGPGKGTPAAEPGASASPATPAVGVGQAAPPADEGVKAKKGVESTVPSLTTVAAPEATTKAETPDAAPEEVKRETEPRQPAAGEQEAYIKAVEPLKQRRFAEAAVTLADFIARYPKSENADKAHFWLAETHYVNRNIAAALSEFQAVLKDYPKSSKVPGALLKIGYIQDDAKDPQAARATLGEIIRRFPQSGEARLAQARLDQMQREGR